MCLLLLSERGASLILDGEEEVGAFLFQKLYNTLSGHPLICYMESVYILSHYQLRVRVLYVILAEK